MKTPRKFNFSKEWLIENYLNTSRSLADVAVIANCSYSVVRKWLFIYGITPKPKYRAALDNLILYQKGNTPWNKGLDMRDSRIKKAILKASATRIKNGANRGDKNYHWKGENVKYKPLHKWVAYHKGKASICVKCGATKNIDWANVSGKYKRDLNDFISLCRSCHVLFDNNRRKAVKL